MLPRLASSPVNAAPASIAQEISGVSRIPQSATLGADLSPRPRGSCHFLKNERTQRIEFLDDLDKGNSHSRRSRRVAGVREQAIPNQLEFGPVLVDRRFDQRQYNRKARFNSVLNAPLL